MFEKWDGDGALPGLISQAEGDEAALVIQRRAPATFETFLDAVNAWPSWESVEEGTNCYVSVQVLLNE